MQATNGCEALQSGGPPTKGLYFLQGCRPFGPEIEQFWRFGGRLIYIEVQTASFTSRCKQRRDASRAGAFVL